MQLKVNLSKKSERSLEELLETEKAVGIIEVGFDSVFLDCYNAFKRRKKYHEWNPKEERG